MSRLDIARECKVFGEGVPTCLWSSAGCIECKGKTGMLMDLLYRSLKHLIQSAKQNHDTTSMGKIKFLQGNLGRNAKLIQPVQLLHYKSEAENCLIPDTHTLPRQFVLTSVTSTLQLQAESQEALSVFPLQILHEMTMY